MLQMWQHVGMTAPDTATPIEARWIPDDSTFGARLAMVRQRMGWGNVAEAARACGLDRESWRLWEQTNREPRRMTTICMTIASHAGCDVDWLLWGPGGKEVADLRGATKKYGSSNIPGMIDYASGTGSTREIGRAHV